MSDANVPSNTGAPAAPTDQSSNAQQAAAVAQVAGQVLNNPNASQAQKAQAVKQLKSLKIKVDGQEYEEQLPFNMPDTPESRDWMTKNLQMSKVAQKRMGEKAQLENEVRDFLTQLKNDPKKLLSNSTYGVDLKKLAAQMIEEEISNAAKSPEQLAKEGLERELSELKEQRKRDMSENERRETDRATQMAYDQYDTQMTQTLEKSDLPKSPYVIKKMADYMLMGLKEGLDVTPEDVLPLVREEILEDIRQMAQAMPLETIEKLFGGDILTKIRKKNVSRAKSQPQTASPRLPDVGATKATKTETVNKDKMKTIKQLWGV
jgi:hypothetical protein